MWRNECSSAYINAPNRIENAMPVFGRFKAARVLVCEGAHMYVCEDVTVQRKVAADLIVVHSKKVEYLSIFGWPVFRCFCFHNPAGLQYSRCTLQYLRYQFCMR